MGACRGARSVLAGRGILEEALAVVLEGCDTFGRRLQCFGGGGIFEGHLRQEYIMKREYRTPHSPIGNTLGKVT